MFVHADSHIHAWVFYLSYLCADGAERCLETGCDVYICVSFVCLLVCVCVYGLADCSLTPGISSSNPHTTLYSRTGPMHIFLVFCSALRCLRVLEPSGWWDKKRKGGWEHVGKVEKNRSL